MDVDPETKDMIAKLQLPLKEELKNIACTSTILDVNLLIKYLRKEDKKIYVEIMNAYLNRWNV